MGRLSSHRRRSGPRWAWVAFMLAACLSVAAHAADATAAFEWAEWKYPELFPKGPASTRIDHLGTAYTVRSYGNGNHLGITDDGGIYGLGPYTAGALLRLGSLETYGALIRADRPVMYPWLAAPATGLNECQPLAVVSQVPGTRYQVVLEGVPPLLYRLTMTQEVIGPASFGTQAATLTRLDTVAEVGSPAAPYTSRQEYRLFREALVDGRVREFGEELTQTEGASAPVRTRTDFIPDIVDGLYTIRVGQMSARNESGTLTGLDPIQPARSHSRNTTRAFEARESITLDGRTFDTCRYRETQGSTLLSRSWVHVGTGLFLRIDLQGSVTQRLEMRTATLNGTPL